CAAIVGSCPSVPRLFCGSSSRSEIAPSGAAPGWALASVMPVERRTSSASCRAERWTAASCEATLNVVFGVMVKAPSCRSSDAGSGTSGRTLSADDFPVAAGCGTCGFGVRAHPAATTAARAHEVNVRVDSVTLSALLSARGAPPPRAAARLASLARRGRRRYLVRAGPHPHALRLDSLR